MILFEAERLKITVNQSFVPLTEADQAAVEGSDFRIDGLLAERLLGGGADDSLHLTFPGKQNAGMVAGAGADDAKRLGLSVREEKLVIVVDGLDVLDLIDRRES